MIAKLVVIEGPGQGTVCILRSRNIFGRHSDCSFVIKDKGVSGNHCKVELVNQRDYVLSDLNSSNGTYLNGRKISTGEKIREGDVVTLGSTKLLFQTESRSHEDSTLMVDMGKFIQENPEEIHCERPVQKDWKFCPYCGKPIVFKK